MTIHKKYIIVAFIGLCVFLAGCTGRATVDNLMGGTWEAKAYKKGELKEADSCSFFPGDVSFISDERIHVEDAEYDMEYRLKHRENEPIIEVYDPSSIMDSFPTEYDIRALSRNEIMILDGKYKHTCLLTREDDSWLGD